MRALLISLVVLLGVALGVDRILCVATEDYLAGVIADEGQLDSEPDITIEGFPFLTQAISGSYSSIQIDVDVAALGLPPGAGAAIDLQGAQAPLRSVFSRSVDRVPVDRIVGTVTFPFDYIGQQLDGATVTRDGSGIRVETTLSLFGQDFPVAATGDLSLVGNVVAVSASGIESRGTQIPDEVTVLVTELLDIDIPVPNLPFGLVFTSIEVVGNGVEVVAEGNDIVLEATV